MPETCQGSYIYKQIYFKTFLEMQIILQLFLYTNANQNLYFLLNENVISILPIFAFTIIES